MAAGGKVWNSKRNLCERHRDCLTDLMCGDNVLMYLSWLEENVFLHRNN